MAQAAPNDPSVHLNMAFAYGGLKKYSRSGAGVPDGAEAQSAV